MNKENLIQSLVEKGWFIQKNLIETDELLLHAKERNLIQGKIGKDAGRHINEMIRTDKTSWIEHDDQNQSSVKKYLDLMNETMLYLNQELFLGLNQFEAHFAHYSKGGFYKKHLDQHQKSNARKISTILYLNTPKNGGELIIYHRDHPDKIELSVSPQKNLWVCFLSDQIFHEVRPAGEDRYSIAGWFRTNVL